MRNVKNVFIPIRGKGQARVERVDDTLRVWYIEVGELPPLEAAKFLTKVRDQIIKELEDPTNLTD